VATNRDGPAPVRLWRYLPVAVLTTGLVIVLPATLVAAIMPRGGVLLMAASAASAVALSTGIASAGAALWKRRPGSRDIVFADLMLWGWLRRCWTERRLSQARSLYDSARKAGPTVSIELLTGLSRLLEARDAYTHGHSQRVARHASRIAHAMHLAPAEVAKIRTAAEVHDVGKLHTPREILNNPGRLNDAEFAVMKRHPVDGEDMLATVGDPEIAAMVRHHHERMDGKGYPDGLVGSEIPLGARIIAVADTFDAITSSRAYRPACTQKKALDILSKDANSQLDGAAVAAFLHRYSARRSVAWFALAAAVPERVFAALQTASLGLTASTGGTSLLPALGAAGLLSLSPGLHQNAPVDRHARRSSALTRSHRPTLPAASPTNARHATTQSGSAQRTPLASHRGHRTVRTSPSTPVSGNPPARTPNTQATGTRSSAREPVAPAATPPPVHSPTPPIPLPVTGTPTPPAPPVSPPVPVPGVNLPPVHVPPIPIPIPTTEAPTTNIPRLP
jgi:HD domain